MFVFDFVVVLAVLCCDGAVTVDGGDIAIAVVIVGSVATFGVGGSVAFAVGFGRCFAAAVGVLLVLWMIYLK